MRYWDASAVVPLLAEEGRSAWTRELFRKDPILMVWWGTSVECGSAIARAERESRLTEERVDQAWTRLRALSRGWHEIAPTEAVRETATRFLRVHPIRSADALQLAAAFMASESRPATLEFVCLDSRLASAAEREGFSVLAAG